VTLFGGWVTRSKSESSLMDPCPSFPTGLNPARETSKKMLQQGKVSSFPIAEHFY